MSPKDTDSHASREPEADHQLPDTKPQPGDDKGTKGTKGSQDEGKERDERGEREEQGGQGEREEATDATPARADELEGQGAEASVPRSVEGASEDGTDEAVPDGTGGADDEGEVGADDEGEVEIVSEVEVEGVSEVDVEGANEVEVKGEVKVEVDGAQDGSDRTDEKGEDQLDEAEITFDPDRRLRQPIVAVLGHVDHGKTSLLDYIRGTAVVAKEAGAITQHIGATEVLISLIQKICGPMLDNIQVQLPGLLFIDTPGHHSFTTLRSRGGALADLAILVIDINEGFKPQTLESLHILRQSKTPFVVALNKIDRVSGWATRKGSHQLNAKNQSKRALTNFDEKFFKVVGQFAEEGFSVAKYTQVSDFTKTIALVPVSAKESGEGLPDLLMVLMGVAQRYLRDRLYLNPGPAEGTVIEVTEVRGLGKTLDVIIYNGVLALSDTILVGATPEPIVSRVKTILRPRPLDHERSRDPYSQVQEVGAAAGVKIVAPHLEGVVSGSPFHSVHPGQDMADALVQLAEEMKPNVSLADEGLVIKADAVGSLEALAYELEAHDINIMAAGVGDVSHRDVVTASTAPTLRRAILAFNAKVLPDARRELVDSGVKLFESTVVYRLVDEYLEWYTKEKEAADAALRETVVYPGKFLLLEHHVFRQKDPAVVGVRVLAGRIFVGQKVLKPDGRVVGRIRSMRSGDDALKEAKQGDEVAVAITNVTVGRQINENDTLLVNLDERDVRNLLSGKFELTPDEEDVLHEVAKIKRRTEGHFWGR